MLEEKGSGAAGGLPGNTWSVRPVSAGPPVSALLWADGRVKQD